MFSVCGRLEGVVGAPDKLDAEGVVACLCVEE